MLSPSRRFGAADDDKTRVRLLLSDFARRVHQADVRDQLDTIAGEVIGALEDAGVEALLLKGPVLARVLYQPDEDRKYADIDVLVDPARLEQARRVLRELGYVSTNELLGVRDVGGALHAEPWTAGELDVDLHWRLAGADGPAQASWDALSAVREVLEIAGRRVQVPGRPALALHIATHAAQHGARHPPGLRDLELSLDRWSPSVWSDAAELARAVDATRAFACGLQQVSSGSAMARKLGLPALSELNWAPVHDSGRPRGTFYLKEFAEAGSLAERAGVLRRSLLPSRTWMTSQYHWARRAMPLLIAAYAVHLMRAPLWAARAWRFRRRANRRP